MAARLSEPLKLVHVSSGSDATLQTRLAEQASKLLAHGAQIEVEALSGGLPDKLIDAAQGARLIVVSSRGAARQDRWLQGSVAEGLAQRAPSPVLVVRDSAGIEAFAAGERALSVMVGVALDEASKAALSWASELRAIGACDLNVTQIAWPFGEHARLGIGGGTAPDQLRPELEQILRRDLQDWAGSLAGPGKTEFSVRPGWGRVDTHLTQCAAETNVDLLVVGTHQRTGLARLWRGSTASGAIRYASCNVASVPRTSARGEQPGIRSFRSVLVATDLSTLAGRAIAPGYGMLRAGGVVHLLFVRDPAAPEPESVFKEKLAKLVPSAAAAKGIETDLHVVSDAEPNRAICRLAGRLGVDAVCMSTRGRGLSALALGSQAQAVLRELRQPLLLVTREPE